MNNPSWQRLRTDWQNAGSNIAISVSVFGKRFETTEPAENRARSRPSCGECGCSACPWIAVFSFFAGGESFGGRMTSQAQALDPLPSVRGLIFLGFPLHPAGKPSDERAKHLFEVRIPMLFLQGTRDEMAEHCLLEGVCGNAEPEQISVAGRLAVAILHGEENLKLRGVNAGSVIAFV